MQLGLVRKWANGEILTDTAPADRRALQVVLDEYDALLAEALELAEDCFYGTEDDTIEAASKFKAKWGNE